MRAVSVLSAVFITLLGSSLFADSRTCTFDLKQYADPQPQWNGFTASAGFFAPPVAFFGAGSLVDQDDNPLNYVPYLECTARFAETVQTRMSATVFVGPDYRRARISVSGPGLSFTGPWVSGSGNLSVTGNGQFTVGANVGGGHGGIVITAETECDSSNIACGGGSRFYRVESASLTVSSTGSCTMSIQSGNNQQGSPGGRLPLALALGLTSGSGRTLPGSYMPSWSASGDARVFGRDKGVATLGSTPGPYSFTASLEGCGSVTFTATALAPCTSTPTITLLDPVPLPGYASALAGNKVDKDKLAIAGLREVQGVSADGQAQTIVRVIGCAHTQYAISLFDEHGNAPFEYRNTVGDLAIAGSETFTSTQLFTTDGNGRASLIYRAPVEFVRSASHTMLNQRAVILRLGNSGQAWDKAITIARPPIVLLHGIWSNDKTWSLFKPVLRQAGLNPLVADYSEPLEAADGFQPNAVKVVLQIVRILQMFRRGYLLPSAPVSAVQVDIVGHSMGGMVTRTMALLPGFANPENLGNGYVRRLITVNTPHLGTPFAVRLQEQPSSCSAVLGTFGMATDKGAVRDLRSDSPPVLQDLRQRNGALALQTHAIAGVASAPQISTSENSLGAFAIKLACPTVLPSNNFQAVFGQPHDLIVDRDSMSALGLGVSGAVPVTDLTGAIHTILPLWLGSGPDVLNRVCTSIPFPSDCTRGPADGRVPTAVLNVLNSSATHFAPILPTFGH